MSKFTIQYQQTVDGRVVPEAGLVVKLIRPGDAFGDGIVVPELVAGTGIYSVETSEYGKFEIWDDTGGSGAYSGKSVFIDSVDSAGIMDDAVIAVKISDGAVTADKLAPNSVINTKINNGAVEEAKLADGSVTAGKIGTGAVTEDKLADDSVGEDNIIDGAVTQQKISDSLISSRNLYSADLAVNDQYINNSDGGLNAHVGRYHTGKIPVIPGNQYSLWVVGTTDMYPYLHAYNQSGIWLYNHTDSAFSASLSSSSIIGDYWIFTAPANCYYVACNGGSWGEISFDDFRNSVVLENGDTLTHYSEYKQVINESIIDNKILECFRSGDITVCVLSDIILIRSSFNDVNDIIMRIRKSYNDNGLVNFDSVALITKDCEDGYYKYYASGEYTTIHAPVDDITPVNVNGTYIGANHGAAVGIIVTSSGHDKTSEDIGSEWKDSTATFSLYLVDINGNNLTFLSDNSGSGAFGFHTSIAAGNITHFSGATHTSSITQDNMVLGQLTPCVRDRSLKMYMDDIEITSNGIYYGNKFDMVERYGISDPVAILDNLASQPNYTLGDSILDHIITYSFTRFGTCTVNTTMKAKQNLDVTYIGGIQAGKLNDAGTAFDTISYYLPGTIPFSYGGHDYDFGAIQDISSSLYASLRIDPSRMESSKVLNRQIQLGISGGNYTVGFALGYLPLDYGRDAERYANCDEYLEISGTSKKLYPRLIDDKYGTGYLLSGETLNFVVYRRYFSPYQSGENITAMYDISAGNEKYLYIDIHGEYNGILAVPQYLVGRRMEVIDSFNCSIVNDDTISAGLSIAVESSESHGYAVIRVM